MRRLGFGALIALGWIAAPACKRQSTSPPAVETAQPGPLLSVVTVSDPAGSAQLVKGFYALEGNAWRWTARKFSVALKPPPGADQNGARLSMKLTVPEGGFKQTGPITVSASVNGLALTPEAYSQPGDYTYTRDVPAAALKGDAVAVDFSADKGFTPPGDARDLALIAVSIGLQPK